MRWWVPPWLGRVPGTLIGLIIAACRGLSAGLQTFPTSQVERVSLVPGFVLSCLSLRSPWCPQWAHLHATAPSVAELQQAVLARLQAAQFLRGDYSNLCVELKIALSTPRFSSISQVRRDFIFWVF